MEHHSLTGEQGIQGLCMSRLKEYVSSILSHGEFDEQDQAELTEEFLSHLHQLQQDYLQAGYSQEEAERLAIRDFGGEQEIGEELQESQSPPLSPATSTCGSRFHSVHHFLLLVFPVFFASFSSLSYGYWYATWKHIALVLLESRKNLPA